MSDSHARPSSRDQRDPQVGVLRSRSSSRDMSWRKPVPKFIPSPPISPGLGQAFGQCQQYNTASPTATTFGYTVDRANPFSMSMASLNPQLPPLPADWKETIDRVVRSESSTNLNRLKTPPASPVLTSPTQGFARGYRYPPGVPQPRINAADKDQSTFQEVDLGEMKSGDRDHSANKENMPPPSFNRGLRRLAISPGVNGSNASISRTPKVYRPPTPPLPSRKRTSAPSTPVTTTITKPVHIIYPELKGLGSEGHSHRARSAEDDIADVHTLRTAHSSLTMWTNARGAPTSDTSSMTDDDDRTLPVYQPHSVRQSTIESKAMLVVEPHDPGSGFWKAFMLWFDSFLNSLKACLSGT